MTKSKTPKTYEQAKKDYNDLMFDLGLEFLSIGTNYSENTDGWNVRDMVSECQYQLDVHYEDGNANNEGQHPDYWGFTVEDLMSERRFKYVQRHNEEQEEMHKDWLYRTRRLRNFIRKYQSLAMKESCTEGHCSKFD